MRRTSITAFLFLATAGPAQELAGKDAALTEALARWAVEFDAGALDPRGDFLRGRDVYGSLIQEGGVLLRYRNSGDHYTHHQMLERMLEEAERGGSAITAHGLLELCGVGLERSPLDGDAQIVRHLASGVVARSMTSSPEFVAIVRETAGEGDFEEWWPNIGARVAALRLLVSGRAAEDREVLVAALGADDPRVRLAAAESLRRRAEIEVLGALTGALRGEEHPVVAQALVQGIGAVLDAGGDALDAGTRDRAVEAVIARLGAVGWRLDVEIVDLVARYPIRSAVPRLIELLGEEPRSQRRAREAEFAPVLRSRALAALRRITGTLAPGEDADAWRTFWAEEGPNVELVARPGSSRGGATSSGGFFGIEVRGRETAFVLDVSRSMRKRIGGVGSDAWRTRLDVAGRQLLAVAQDMPRAWRFRVIAFADEPRVWNDRGTRADARTMRALTAFLEEQSPGGRTDLRAALRLALGVDDLRYGQEARHPVDEVFVLSDGLPADADGPQDPEEVLAWVREVNRYQKIRIHAVMAGSGELGAAFLRRLAEENGGEFVQR